MSLVKQATRLGIALCLFCAEGVSGQGPTATAALESYLATLDRAGLLSGTILVARGDTVLFERSYGRRDYRTGGGAITPETVFPIASLTKPLTGIIARTLVERGALRLEDSISKWLPAFPDGARITVGHLVTHRSGLPHRATTLAEELQPQTTASMASIISRARLLSAPGEQRSYSSAGFTLLARVLELAAGASYAELVRDIITKPAGAVSTFDATERPMRDRAQMIGFLWSGGVPVAALPRKDVSFLAGAGSIHSTPRDLHRIVRHIAAGSFGAAAAGARVEDGSIQWTGFTNGFRAVVDYNAATQTTLVCTMNILTAAPDWLRRDLRRLLAGESVSLSTSLPAPVELSESRRKVLEGVYRNFGAEQELVFLTPAIAQLAGEYPLVATGDTTFYSPIDDMHFVVVADAAGNVTEIRSSNVANAIVIPRLRGR